MASTNFVSQYNQWNNSTTQVRMTKTKIFYSNRLLEKKNLHLQRDEAYLFNKLFFKVERVQ